MTIYKREFKNIGGYLTDGGEVMSTSYTLAFSFDRSESKEAFEITSIMGLFCVSCCDKFD